MRICKCKYKNGNMHIEYMKPNNKKGWDEFSFTCADEPRPEYERAMDKLKPFVTQLCELPGELNSRISVNSVSFSWTDDGIMGAVICSTMGMKKSNGVLVLNTPHKASRHASPNGDDTLLLPSVCVDILEDIHSECKAYIRGERAQGDMFAKPEPK